MKYVHTFTDRHGKTRHYFRRGSTRRTLPAPGTPEFARAYLRAMSGADAPIDNSVLISEYRVQARKRVLTPPRMRMKGGVAGVYLLLLSGRVIYVGSSEDMKTRVATHRANGRPFDRVYFIPTPGEQRLVLERILIAAIRPEQNRLGLEPGTAIGKPAERGAKRVAKSSQQLVEN